MEDIERLKSVVLNRVSSVDECRGQEDILPQIHGLIGIPHPFSEHVDLIRVRAVSGGEVDRRMTALVEVSCVGSPFKLNVVRAGAFIRAVPLRLFAALGECDAAVVGDRGSDGTAEERTCLINVEDVLRSRAEEETTATEPTIPLALWRHELEVSGLLAVNASHSIVVRARCSIGSAGMGNHHLVVRAGAEVGVCVGRSEPHVLHVRLVELRVKDFGVADNIEP